MRGAELVVASLKLVSFARTMRALQSSLDLGRSWRGLVRLLWCCRLWMDVGHDGRRGAADAFGVVYVGKVRPAGDLGEQAAARTLGIPHLSVAQQLVGRVNVALENAKGDQVLGRIQHLLGRQFG